MSFFISLGIVLLSMLILVFLQLNPGVFMLFYHYTIGKNSAKKTDHLSIYYILGVEIFFSALFLLIYSLVIFLFTKQTNFDYSLIYWPLAGIFLALSIVCLFFYYRKGKGTKLFISRHCANNIMEHAKNIKNPSDAFMLGLVTSSLELFFSLPIFILCALEIMKLDHTFRIISIILIILSSVLPLFVIYYSYRFGNNMANVERFREKNKIPIKIFLFICFLLLSFLTIGSEFL